jgi:hypothetical protein
LTPNQTAGKSEIKQKKAMIPKVIRVFGRSFKPQIPDNWRQSKELSKTGIE